jgi:hypothetical protein
MKPTTTLYASLAAISLSLCLGTLPALGDVTVSVQPGSQVVLVGNNAVFNAQVSTTAGETITGYTWKMSPSNQPPYTVIAGATTATCTLTNVQMSDAGSYFVVVTYNSGPNIGLTSVSAAANLTVYDQARIVVQPQGGLIRPTGSNATFSVSALGSAPLTYQWRLNGVNLANNPRISGATSSNLTVSALITADSGSYVVVVSNIYSAATSQVATLSVYIPPGISVQPPNTAVIVGSNAVLSVTATGTTPLGYVWRKDGTVLSNGGRISGATTNKLTIAATVTNDAGGYTVAISNIVGSITSSTATLTILVPATFTSPTNASGRQGEYFAFTNTATGTTPITFGAQGLPPGLNIDKDSGVISGIPALSGLFPVAIFATNAAMTTPGQLLLTLTTGIPGITSPLFASAKQGQPFSYTITATNVDVGLPISFSASSLTGLPTGLVFDSTNGIISGTPLVFGSFPIDIGVTNAYGGDSKVLTVTVATSVPVITSSTNVNGKQGNALTYTIAATDNPTVFTASTLPIGLSFSPVTGVISGVPIVNGTYPITITAGNQFGADTKVLTLTLATALPVITSARTVAWTENLIGFSYTIRASNLPTSYGASNLPLGLILNPTNGVISGTPWYGGTFTVPVWANNAWGTGTTNVVMTFGYAPLTELAIANVVTNWSKPYLLNFTFSLRDSSDPVTSKPVVRPPSAFQVTCWEDGVPISAEAPLILESATGTKQLKTFLALDYTYSMFSSPGAISNMEFAANLLIGEEPPHALFGIVEFNADYMAPQFVTNSLTSSNNYFIADKTVLAQSIAGIQTNYVQGNYAGTRCWDAMYAALTNFGPANVDEQRYLVALTDGNDASSLLNTDSDPMTAVNTLVKTAQKNHVAIYCVAYTTNINVTALQALTDQTGGRYYVASSTDDLASQFQSIQKDISGQYVLRWATLKRQTVPAYKSHGFQPSFQISYGGLSDSWNTDIHIVNYTNADVDPPDIYPTNEVQFPFDPPTWAGDVKLGSLRLVTDADLGPQTIRLRASYVPRFVREIRLDYRPNYPCTASLNSTGTNEILRGWTMSETSDTNGLRTLTMISADTNNLLTSIPYAGFGDLVSFQFKYPESVTSTQAFSVFTNDNTIFTNFLPGGVTFTNENFTNFITAYPAAPPYGTPIPWLIYYGFKTNFAAAELIATNGLPVWQDYLAGLNPTNPASRFWVSTARVSNGPPLILFSTVLGRTYRLETTTTIQTNWSLLRDNMPGIGGNILFIDNRNLSGVNSVFYRVAVY